MPCSAGSARSNVLRIASVALPNLRRLRLGDERRCNRMRRADHEVREANAAVRLRLFGIRDHGGKNCGRDCKGTSGGNEAERERGFHVNGLSAGDYVRSIVLVPVGAANAESCVLRPPTPRSQSRKTQPTAASPASPSTDRNASTRFAMRRLGKFVLRWIGPTRMTRCM